MLCAVRRGSCSGADSCDRVDIPTAVPPLASVWAPDGICAVLGPALDSMAGPSLLSKDTTAHASCPAKAPTPDATAATALSPSNLPSNQSNGHTQAGGSQGPDSGLGDVGGGGSKASVGVGARRQEGTGCAAGTPSGEAAEPGADPGIRSRASDDALGSLALTNAQAPVRKARAISAIGSDTGAAEAPEPAAANAAATHVDAVAVAAPAVATVTVCFGNARHGCSSGASQHAWDLAASAREPPPPRPHNSCLPYSPYILRACVFTKIPGYQPAQITPGYEQRLALLVAALGSGGGRRLGSVYVRSGCVELIMEEEEWASGGLEDVEGEEQEEEEAVGAAGAHWLGADGGGDIDGPAAAAAAASVPPRPPVEQQNPLRRQFALGEAASESTLGGAASGSSGAGGSLHGPSGPGSASPPAPGAWGRVEALRRLPAGGGGSGAPPLLQAPSGSSGFRSHSQSHSSRSSSLSSMELAVIIQALQLRDEQELVSEEEAEAGGAEAAGGLGGVQESSGVELDGAAVLYGTVSGEMEARHVSDGGVSLAAPLPPTANLQTPPTASRLPGEPPFPAAPFMLGAEGERQTGICVLALQPRVMLLAPPATPPPPPPPPPPEGPASHAAVPASPARPAGQLGWAPSAIATQPPQPQPRHQGRARGLGDWQQQPHSQPHPPPFSPNPSPLITDQSPGRIRNQNPTQPQNPNRSLELHPQLGARDAALRRGGAAAQQPATAAAGTATLRALLHCPVALTAAEEGPEALEVLLRSQGAYLPLRARWQLSDAVAAEADAEADAEAAELAEAREGEGEAGASAGGWAQRAIGAGGAGGSIGAVVPRALPDAMRGPDVNQTQLLELELMELPARPGIALVDFRWRGRPCRAVPLVLTCHPAVAEELQTAIAAWTRPQAELDELLLDYGTWEFHVSDTVHLPRSSTINPPIYVPVPNPTAPPATAAGVSAATATPAATVMTGTLHDSWDSSSSGSLPVRATRLLDLGSHLLRYMNACGWVHTARHIRSQLHQLSAAGGTSPRGPAGASAPARAAAVAAAAAAAGPAAATGVGAIPGGSGASDGGRPAAAAAIAAVSPAEAVAGGVAEAAARVPGEARRRGVTAVDEDGKEERLTVSELALGEVTLRITGRGAVGTAAGTYGGGDGGASGGDDRAAAAGGALMQPRVPWASAVLLPALGFGRTTPAEAAAYVEYVDPWVIKLSPVMLSFDLCSLSVLLLRERHQLLAPCSASILTACAVSLALVLARLVLPYATWVRLLRPSRHARIVGYCAAKGLVALGGFPMPQGVSSYARGGALLLTEGVVLPAASVLSPVAAAVLLSVLAAMTSKMLLTVGAVTRGSDAALHGLCSALLGLATTIACHAYLRYHFWWHRNRPGQGHGHGPDPAPPPPHPKND